MAGGSGDDAVEVGCGGDPGAYAAVLKRKLDLYCAAVAKSMVRILLCPPTVIKLRFFIFGLCLSVTLV
jgi:hypothetical protein